MKSFVRPEALLPQTSEAERERLQILLARRIIGRLVKRSCEGPASPHARARVYNEIVTYLCLLLTPWFLILKQQQVGLHSASFSHTPGSSSIHLSLTTPCHLAMARRISNKTQSTGDRDEYQQSLSAPYSSYQPQTQMHSDYYQQAPGHSHQFHPYQAQSMNNAISERYRAQSKSAAGQSSASATQMPESAQRSDLSSPYADYSDKDAEAGRYLSWHSSATSINR